MTDAALLARLEREAGMPGMVAALERLSPTDLQSLLLHLHERLAGRVTPGEVLEQYGRNRFVAPAPTDVVALLDFELRAARLLPAGYVPLELAPVAPLATHSGLATVHQSKVLTTNRNTEVVADSTNVMALESAVRRRAALRANAKSAAVVKLYSSHRLTRAQKFEGPGLYGHFRILALTAAGRDVGGLGFELDALGEQLAYHLRVLAACGLEARIMLTDLTAGERLTLWRERVVEPLTAAHGAAEVGFDPSRQSGRGYYMLLCFKIHARHGEGEWLEVGDGGFTDWTQQLLSSRKERLLTSCLASERVLRLVSA